MPARIRRSAAKGQAEWIDPSFVPRTQENVRRINPSMQQTRLVHGHDRCADLEADPHDVVW